MLDEEHPILPAADPQDTNSYLLGRIGPHNVVIACLPAETTGKVLSKFGLMVGIGGGAPYYSASGKDTQDGEPKDSDSEDEDSEDDFEDTRDIRLGDVVISLHSKSTEAVVQYDFGKSVQEKKFIHTGGKLNNPPNIVLNAVSMLQSQHERKGHKIPGLLSKMVSENPRIATKFQCPGSAKDRLFKLDVVHVDEKKSAPSLRYGTIGSADQMMKDATLRDQWAQMEKIICFEMLNGLVSMSRHSRYLQLCGFP
ncbi:hypothetical protein BJ875DRAFT_504599 [Amylocarpus encephaloides]|uniref:Uncharacterized protein n=1 Tax=Amylocarpus encephaloides TaxID=45428 RepID=A0A9P7YIN8_9HELO|nr:hypothetical protein BJ875DRAFT_504599 [Amylocarpus encephaloides]